MLFSVLVPDFDQVFTPKQRLKNSGSSPNQNAKAISHHGGKGEDITQTGWNEKEQAIQEGYIWAVEPNALYQINRAEYKTEPDIIQIKDLIGLFSGYYMPKHDTYHNRVEFFQAEQTKDKTTYEFWR